MSNHAEVSSRSLLVPSFARVALFPAVAVIIALLAWALRAYALDYSLPYIDHPDEPNLVTYALRTLTTGDPNPQVFRKPSLYFYMLLPVLWGHYRWGQTAGLYGDLAQMAPTTYLYTTAPGFFYWGRMLTASLGGATSLALFAVGRRMWGPGAGLLAALVLAALPFHMRHSQYVTTDVPSAWFVLLAFGAAAAVAETGSLRAYLLAGLLTGLAGATKYNAAVVATAIAGAHLLYWRRASMRRLGLLVGAGLAAGIGFVIGTPYALLDWRAFRSGVISQFRDYNVTVHGDFTGAWNIEGYLDFFWGDGLGPLGCVVAVVGIGVLLVRRRTMGLVWLAFAIPYLLALLAQQTHFYRNLMPLIVLCALPIGVGLITLWEWFRAKIPAGAHAPAAVAGLAIVLLPWFIPSLNRAASLALPDSRVAAQETLRERWPGVRVAAELSQVMRWNGLSQSTYLHYLPLRPLSWYREQGYGLLLSTSGKRQGYGWPLDYDPLLAEGKVVATFGGPASGYRGPQVDILDTGLTPAAAPVEGPRARIGPLDLLGVSVGRLVETTTGPEVVLEHRLSAGDTLTGNVFWTAWQTPPQAPYVVFVHLRDQEGRTLVQRDTPPWLGLFPVHSWPVGQVVVDALDLPLPENLPPGEYRLWIGLYDPTTQLRYSATVDGERLAADEIDLGVVEVTAPERASE